MDERRDDTSSGRAGAATFPSEGKASRETMDKRRETGDEVKREERKEKREKTGDERRETGDEVKREERKEKREETGDERREEGDEVKREERKEKREETGRKRREIPWKEIREEYVRHAGSYRELGTKYGIPFTQIGRRGRQENWTELRAAADYKAMTETVLRASKARARANLDALQNLNLLTAKLRNYCEEMLDDPTQRGKVLSSGRDWDGLAGMLERIEGIERRMMDIQSEADRRAEEREKKKLRLQEIKAEQGEGPKEIKVVMENGDEFAH